MDEERQNGVLASVVLWSGACYLTYEKETPHYVAVAAGKYDREASQRRQASITRV